MCDDCVGRSARSSNRCIAGAYSRRRGFFTNNGPGTSSATDRARERCDCGDRGCRAAGRRAGDLPAPGLDATGLARLQRRGLQPVRHLGSPRRGAPLPRRRIPLWLAAGRCVCSRGLALRQHADRVSAVPAAGQRDRADAGVPADSTVPACRTQSGRDSRRLVAGLCRAWFAPRRVSELGTTCHSSDCC